MRYPQVTSLWSDYPRLLLKCVPFRDKGIYYIMTQRSYFVSQNIDLKDMSPKETHEVVTAGGLVENEPPADRREPLPPSRPRRGRTNIKKHYNYELFKFIIPHNIPSI